MRYVCRHDSPRLIVDSLIVANRRRFHLPTNAHECSTVMLRISTLVVRILSRFVTIASGLTTIYYDLLRFYYVSVRITHVCSTINEDLLRSTYGHARLPTFHYASGDLIPSGTSTLLWVIKRLAIYQTK